MAEFGETPAPGGDAFDKLFPSETPAPAEPTPAAPSPAETTPAAVVPAQPEATPPAAVPAPEPAAQPPVVDLKDDYIGTLKQQNLELTQRLQEQAVQQRALLDQQLKAQQPALSAEERQAKIAAAFEALNQDPEAYIQGLVDAKIAAQKAELEGKFAPRDALQEANKEIGQNLDRLWKDDKGKEIRPELAKKEFRDLMTSGEVSDSVYQKLFSHMSPGQAARDPQFYVELYHEARGRAQAQFAPTQQKAQADAAAQAAVAASHGTPPNSGKSPSGAPPPVDEGEQFKAQMRAVASPTDILLKALGGTK